MSEEQSESDRGLSCDLCGALDVIPLPCPRCGRSPEPLAPARMPSPAELDR